jgi:hypothetical protein
MDIASINGWAVLVSSVAAFVVGWLWYGPLFGVAWQKANNLTDEDIARSNMPLIFGGSFALILLAAFSLAMFIGKEADWSFGLFAGAMTGIFFVSTFLGVLYLFERKGLGLYLINAGYCSATFALMGLILGSWH